MIREIYYNINKRIFSIRAKKTPVSYARIVKVDLPKFVVRQGGRAAVLRDRQKNVHAFIKGEMQELDTLPNVKGLRKISYDPYKFGYFFCVNTNEPIDAAQFAVLTLDQDNKPHVYIKE
jgi:hypothetical protein